MDVTYLGVCHTFVFPNRTYKDRNHSMFYLNPGLSYRILIHDPKFYLSIIKSGLFPRIWIQYKAGQNMEDSEQEVRVSQLRDTTGDLVRRRSSHINSHFQLLQNILVKQIWLLGILMILFLLFFSCSPSSECESRQRSTPVSCGLDGYVLLSRL